MSRKPLTLAERTRKHADSTQLRYDTVRELFEEFAELIEAAEAYAETSVSEGIEQLTDAVSALETLSAHGIGLNDQQLAQLTAQVEDLSNGFPDTDDVQTLIDAVQVLEETLDQVQEHRDTPGDYDPGERAEARDAVRDALSTIADTLDDLEPPPPPTSIGEDTP